MGCLRFSVLASGSSGNACYVETREVRILIDAGLSGRETERRLARIGVSPGSLDALIITHEHADHIKGAGPLARRYEIPIYLNQKTLDQADRRLGRLPRSVIVQTGEPFFIRDLRVETFTKWAHEYMDEMSAKDKFFAKVWNSQQAFGKRWYPFHRMYSLPH